MKQPASIFCVLLSVFVSCTSQTERPPSGPVAKFGSAPTIDGTFGAGEWDDADTIRVDSSRRILLKHDRENLYLALDGSGGNLYFLKNDSIYVLHSSFSLGWARYVRSADQTWSCDSGFVWELHRLQTRTEPEIREAMHAYLQKEGWVASLIPMGNIAQTEFAISFRWLGIAQSNNGNRYVEIPKVLVWTCLNIPPEERKGRNPVLAWPPIPAPNDSLNYGSCPKTIAVDSTQWGRIWIKLGN